MNMLFSVVSYIDGVKILIMNHSGTPHSSCPLESVFEKCLLTTEIFLPVLGAKPVIQLFTIVVHCTAYLISLLATKILNQLLDQLTI
jgi:hypothetical protein